MLSIKAALPFVDVLLFYPGERDSYLIQAVKTRFPEVIVTQDLERAIKQANAILYGIGLNNTFLPFPETNKKLIIDGDGIYRIPSKLNSRVLLTPNKKEFFYLSKTHPSPEAVKALANSLNCLILAKGYNNFFSDGKKVLTIKGGNPGLTKAGTGDVLSGFISALATTNDLEKAAINGLSILLNAADLLYKKYSYFYTASQLAEYLPIAYKDYLNL